MRVAKAVTLTAKERITSLPSACRSIATQEWLKFLKKIDRETLPELDLHLIVDNYATHKHPKVQRWLKREQTISYALHADEQFLVESGSSDGSATSPISVSVAACSRASLNWSRRFASTSNITTRANPQGFVGRPKPMRFWKKSVMLSARHWE